MKSVSGCIICGKSPTVRSHVLPKGLMRDMIDTPQGLTVVSRDSDRSRLSQSGLIDANLLCSEHEKATEAYDKYGVEFCRAFEQLAVPTETGNGFMVPNPKPQMLARFIYACVWRYVTSRYGTEVALNLGRYEAIMRGCIFEGAECTLPVIVGLSHLRDSNGEPQTICVAPFYSRAAPANRWVLTIGYLDLGRLTL